MVLLFVRVGYQLHETTPNLNGLEQKEFTIHPCQSPTPELGWAGPFHSFQSPHPSNSQGRKESIRVPMGGFSEAHLEDAYIILTQNSFAKTLSHREKKKEEEKEKKIEVGKHKTVSHGPEKRGRVISTSQKLRNFSKLKSNGDWIGGYR